MKTKLKEIRSQMDVLATKKWIMVLITLIVGQYGIHCFILRKYWIGALMLVLSIFGISPLIAIVHAVLIAIGKFKMADVNTENADNKDS